MTDAREEQAQRLDRAAHELEQAAKHCRTAAAHFRDAEVPRACAHTVAADGHLREARDVLNRVARAHAERATPDGE